MAGPGERRGRRLALGLLLLLAGCAAARGEGGAAVKPPPSGETLLAHVDTLLLPHELPTGRPLCMRLVGSVGPDGSWALDRIDVQRTAQGVDVRPRVRRVPGDLFIQMVMPLDTTVSIALGEGTHRITVHGRAGARSDTVRVRAGVRASPPTVEVSGGAGIEAGPELLVPIRITARVADGFVAQLELRHRNPGVQAPWRRLEAELREGSALMGTWTLRRPAGDSSRLVEARAADGQGNLSDVAVIVLPPR